ncbi:MAG: polysaccharide biosynthesis protein, partial [Acidobacteriota bacterium]|nr:polysaccharide biosynthesis protein [Acidobacteriota bacterium]
MSGRIRSAAFPVHRHSLLQFVLDGFLVAFAYLLAFWLRFDGLPGAGRNAKYIHLLNHTLWWVVPLTLIVLAGFGVYERLWTYIGQRDFEQVAKGAVVATLLVVGAIALVHPAKAYELVHPAIAGARPRYIRTGVPLPASVAVLFLLLMSALLAGARFITHLVTEGRIRNLRVAKGTRDVLIVGAGEGGRLVVRELMRNRELRMRPAGFIDDDPRKRGLKDEYGLRVLGTTRQDDLERVLDELEPDEVVIAIPSAPGSVRAAVVSSCRQRGIPVRTTPTVFELLQDGAGQLRVTRQLREVQVEDILGREPVHMELERVGAYLSGKVVMVTGAGGSIGAELCRQIARVSPRKLVLVDHAEDNLFEIARELTE